MTSVQERQAGQRVQLGIRPVVLTGLEGAGYLAAGGAAAFVVRNRVSGGSPWTSMALASVCAAALGTVHFARTARGEPGPLRLADQAIDKGLAAVAPAGSVQRDVAITALQVVGGAMLLYGKLGHNPHRIKQGKYADIVRAISDPGLARDHIKYRGKSTMWSGVAAITYGQSLRAGDGVASDAVNRTFNRPTPIDHVDRGADTLEQPPEAAEGAPRSGSNPES